MAGLHRYHRTEELVLCFAGALPVSVAPWISPCYGVSFLGGFYKVVTARPQEGLRMSALSSPVLGSSMPPRNFMIAPSLSSFQALRIIGSPGFEEPNGSPTLW